MSRDASAAEPGAADQMGLVDELLAAPVIRPTAVARGRARVESTDRCPADALASQLVDDLVREPHEAAAVSEG
jgi:hypothetical protein